MFVCVCIYVSGVELFRVKKRMKDWGGLRRSVWKWKCWWVGGWI